MPHRGLKRIRYVFRDVVQTVNFSSDGGGGGGDYDDDDDVHHPAKCQICSKCFLNKPCVNVNLASNEMKKN